MRIRFLGSGTSQGVPMIGCDCAVCHSDDPRDRRLRPSIYVEGDDGASVLVDTTPDLRAQVLAAGIRRVDAILFTHAHADHIFGLDDVRRFNVMMRQPIPCYASAATLDDLRRVFSYAFESTAPKGTGVPDLRFWPIGGPFMIGRQDIWPIRIHHGSHDILGFRFGRLAYLTDCSGIPDASLPRLEGLDVLVLDALRHRPHPTHFSVDESVAMAQRIGARATYFTHICHDLGHAETCASLPPGIALAYDGLTIEIDHASATTAIPVGIA